MSVSCETKRRVAIFFLDKNIMINPSMIHTVRLLSQNGYAVDLVVPWEPHWQLPAFQDSNVRVFYSPSTHLGVLRLLRDIFFSLRVCLGHPYYCVIGADPNGLITATILSMFRRTPVIYYSFEIWILHPRSSLLHRFKKSLERWCHRRTNLTIIQDPGRAKVLTKENRVSDAEVVIIPNAPAGPPPYGPEGDFWHRKFGIPVHRTILLCAGGIADHNCVLELAQIAHTWSEDLVLVIHGYAGHGGEDYLNQVQQFVDGQHVVLSLEMVPYERLDYIVRSADIGIALYNRSYNANMTQIGLGSGKICQYLRCGLPVIASDLPDLRELLVDHGCGIVISGVGQIESVTREILCRYEEYSSQSQGYYKEHGDFEQHFQAVLKHLSHVGGR